MEIVCSETNFYHATWYYIPRCDIFLKEDIISSVKISRTHIQSFDVEAYQTVMSQKREQDCGIILKWFLFVYFIYIYFLFYLCDVIKLLQEWAFL
jgi:hypothetical protein